MGSPELPKPSSEQMKPVRPETAARNEVNRLLKGDAMAFLGTTIDVFDSLATDALANPNLPTPISTGLAQVHDMALAFSDLGITAVTGSPRTPRGEDRVRFLPGQHQGVNLQLVSETGDTAFINLYGGLRIVDEGGELKDGTNAQALGRTHSDRTDAILSQPVHLNLHVRSANDAKLFDIWLKYNLNSQFRLEGVLLGDERIDVNAVMPNSDSRFKELAIQMSKYSSALTTLIPTAQQ